MNKREELVQKVVDKSWGWVVGGHENGIMDGVETEMPDREALVDEIYDEVMNTDWIGTMRAATSVGKDIRFLGREKIQSMIREKLEKEGY